MEPTAPVPCRFTGRVEFATSAAPMSAEAMQLLPSPLPGSVRVIHELAVLADGLSLDYDVEDRLATRQYADQLA